MLLRGQRLADHTCEGDGASAAVAGGHVRIRMRVVRSRIDARDIEALDRFASVVYGLEVLVDGDAVQGAQHVAGGAHAVAERYE